MNKKTLCFSNIIGEDKNVKFNEYMEEYLINNIDNTYSLIIIDAPGLGKEEYYIKCVLNCFHKINMKFTNTLFVNKKTTKEEVEYFIHNNKKIVYFLMGGNPYSQMKIIEDLNMKDSIKNHNDLVIGFCAGSINLSTYSIITTDDDFDKPDSYLGIGRENICIEPHYNNPKDTARNNELKNFSKKYNTKIYCIPDESIIYFKNGKKVIKGEIHII